MLTEYQEDENMDLEFPCPNCGIVIIPEESHKLSFNCIVRNVYNAEKQQQRAIRRALRSDGQESEIPVAPENIGELFTTSSLEVVPLPPILAAMKCTLPEIRKRKALLAKEVHVCDSCYDRFIDEEEVERAARKERADAKKKTAREQAVTLRATAAQSAPHRGSPREPNPIIDMAFTPLQVQQRRNHRALELKQLGREQLMVATGSNTDALAVDWETLPPLAARELKRTAAMTSSLGGYSPAATVSPLRRSRGGSPPSGTTSPRRRSGGKLDPLLSSGGGGEGVSSPRRRHSTGSVDFCGLGDCPVTAFDVPMEARLMSDLYDKMCAVCGDTAVENSFIPDTHPYHSIYRNNHNRLPLPPVPHVCLDIPPALGNLPPEKLRALSSDVKAMEEAPLLEEKCRVKVSHAMRAMGLGGLKDDEIAMLDNILQDSTIVVPDDADDYYGSDYNSEGSDEEWEYSDQP